MPKSIEVGDQEVQMDRRRADRRSDEESATDSATTDLVTTDVAAEDASPEFNPPRRKKQRRRQIDPTTCERDYNGQEIEFMQALDAYKRSSGRMFPTCSEILEVIRDLGYVQLCEEDRVAFQSIDDLEEGECEETTDLDVDCELEEELDEAAF